MRWPAAASRQIAQFDAVIGLDLEHLWRVVFERDATARLQDESPQARAVRLSEHARMRLAELSTATRVVALGSGEHATIHFLTRESVMAQQRLNENDYIAELNRRLQQHSEFSPGMAFLPYPEGATGGNIRGIAISGFVYNRAFIETSNAMQNDFDIEPTYVGFQREIQR